MSTPELQTEDIVIAVHTRLKTQLPIVLPLTEARRNAEDFKQVTLPPPVKVTFGYDSHMMNRKPEEFPRVAVLNVNHQPAQQQDNERISNAIHRVPVEWVVMVAWYAGADIDELREQAIFMSWRYGETIAEVVRKGAPYRVALGASSWKPTSLIPFGDIGQSYPVPNPVRTGELLGILAGGALQFDLEGRYVL